MRAIAISLAAIGVAAMLEGSGAEARPKHCPQGHAKKGWCTPGGRYALVTHHGAFGEMPALSRALARALEAAGHYASALAVYEFTAELDGIIINGVDMIHWNADGKIDDFKVMIRPLKAVNLLHRMMGHMLQQMG